MNFLTFVFSLLLIFSFGTFVTLEKQMGNQKLRKTYLGHVAANRKILSKAESETYNSFSSISKPADKKAEASSSHESKGFKVPKINPECSRLNLWPLIQSGREENPFLYDTAIKLLDTFYGSNLFENKPQAKVLFLNAFLKKAKEEIQKKPFFCLEKLSFDPSFQLQYYQMLKGTKEWDLAKNIGYPSLLDVVCVKETPSKICLFHAHPGQVAALFGKKAGPHLYQEIHKEKNVVVTKELIEKVCAEQHLVMLDPNLFDLIEMGRPSHAKLKKNTLIAEDKDTKISLRKNIYNSREG